MMPRLEISSIISIGKMQTDLVDLLRTMQDAQSKYYDNIRTIDDHITTMKLKKDKNDDSYMSHIEFELSPANMILLEQARIANAYYYDMYTAMIDIILKGREQ